MYKDLLFIAAVRENMKQAVAKATKMCEENEIDGVVLSFHVLDVPKDKAGRNRNHRFIHTESKMVGFCATDDFEKQFLHHISDCHKILIQKDRQISFSNWSRAEAATKRIEQTLDEDRNIDSFFAVWGGYTTEPNQKLLDILVENL